MPGDQSGGPASIYGAEYYGEGRDPSSREGRSGYQRYDRASSGADVAAYIAFAHFPADTALDVGCALGFVVQALREVGVDARGVDVSEAAIARTPASVRPHVSRGDPLAGLAFPDGAFQLVTALEVLEHLPPADVPRALRELRRICGRWLLATIPSFGPNAHGPDGFFDGKVRWERLEHYRSLGDAYDGPVPEEDLLRDRAGNPIEGHLTIASYRWWSRQFEAAGFIRCGAVEERIHPDLWRLGRQGIWCPYVLRVPDVPEPVARPPELAAALAARFGLPGLEMALEIRARLQRALGSFYPLAWRWLIEPIASRPRLRAAVTSALAALSRLRHDR